MPEPAHSKTRATAAIAASVLSVTGVGTAHADVQVQNTGGIASSTAVEPDNPPSATNATPIENVATQTSPQVYVEQGVVINPARSQSITVTGEGFTGGAVERYGVAVYVSEYRQYPLYALGRGSAVTMTLVPELDVDGGRFSTQLTLPAGTLDPNQQYVVATAVVDPAKGYATEDPSYNSSAPLELLPANTQDEPLNAQILSGQMEIPQEKNLVVYKVTGLGEAQAFEVMTYVYALDSQGNRMLLAVSPARADVVNGTLLDGIEVPGSMLEEVQNVHENLRYVLSVEVAPSAANGYTAQEVEVPFMNGWNVQNGSAPVATAERAMAEQAQFKKKQSAEEAQPEQATQPTQGVQSEQVASSNTAEQFDHVLPEDDPRRHYDLPRNTLFDRVHDTTKEDTTEEQTNDTANPVMTARLHVEETVVPENDSAKTLTLRGEGFTGVSSVHLMVSAVDEYGVAIGGVIASADVSEIDASGAFTAQVQIPGSALKPGTTYRVSAVAEDEQGTVRMVNGGFTVERDGVDSQPAAPLPTTPEQDAPTVEAPAADTPAVETPAVDASVPTEPAADQASATEQKAGESGAEQKNDAPASDQGAPAQNVPAQNASAQKVEAQKGNAQKAEAQASGSQKVASGAQQKREQLAATGASNMLVISAAGSLSLLAGMRLSRRRRSEMQLSSRR
ncbi:MULTISPECIES: adhesin [unclassified Rothia (in: high G+C Gram-positive bacteria)]|uniref:adhesin n=1 Tax=unclassified Rothia (in: high G+C Gram-positive bacteria) TaxID=2689056 RepID=UPI0008A15A59|nr:MULTISPECIES: adhesin [unclassified Rothia (in: high G+C Gram-positive bacteria)]OFO20776.1 adhesin [Rothia sp. HMSC061C12]OFR45482.1 adhesin [Rothia sp. HMSC073B08]